MLRRASWHQRAIAAGSPIVTVLGLVGSCLSMTGAVQATTGARVVQFQATPDALGTPTARLVIHSAEYPPAPLRPCVPEDCPAQCLRGWPAACAACYGGVGIYTFDLTVFGVPDREDRDFLTLYLRTPAVGRLRLFSCNADATGALHFQARLGLWGDLLTQPVLDAEIVAEYDDGLCGSGSQDRVILRATDQAL